MTQPRLDLQDERVLDALKAHFVPYSYGAGKPSDGWDNWPAGAIGGAGMNAGKGARGWDCSGFAQALLVRWHMLPADAPDRNAAALASQLAPRKITEENARLGDLAFYGTSRGISHVMVCLGYGAVIGASGGGSLTNGDNPNAYVRLQPLRYRPDLVCIGRIA